MLVNYSFNVHNIFNSFQIKKILYVRARMCDFVLVVQVNSWLKGRFQIHQLINHGVISVARVLPLRNPKKASQYAHPCLCKSNRA